MAQNKKTKLEDYRQASITPAPKINILNRGFTSLVRSGISALVGAIFGASIVSIYMFLTSLTGLFDLSFVGSVGLFSGFSGFIGIVFASTMRGGPKNAANKKQGALNLLFAVLAFVATLGVLVGIHALLTYTALNVGGLFLIAAGVGGGACALLTAVSEYLRVLLPDEKALDKGFQVPLSEGEQVRSRIESLNSRLQAVVNSTEDRPAIAQLQEKFQAYYHLVGQHYQNYSVLKKRQSGRIFYGLFSKEKRKKGLQGANWLAGQREGISQENAEFCKFFEGPAFHLLLEALEGPKEGASGSIFSDSVRNELQNSAFAWILSPQGQVVSDEDLTRRLERLQWSEEEDRPAESVEPDAQEDESVSNSVRSQQELQESRSSTPEPSERSESSSRPSSPGTPPAS